MVRAAAVVMVMAMTAVTIWIRLAWQAVIAKTVLEDEQVILLADALTRHKRVQDWSKWI